MKSLVQWFVGKEARLCPGSSHVYRPGLFTQRCQACGWHPDLRIALTSISVAAGKDLDDLGALHGVSRGGPETDAGLRTRILGPGEGADQ